MEEMKAEERRRAIAKTLTAEHPVSATALAGQFSVSRQIIVGDIALLRAAGLDIVATPRGYKLGETTGLLRAVACVHSAQETETELLAMVDNGCTVIDVVVDHPLYGQMTGQLSLASRYDVRQFVEKAKKYNILMVPGRSFACPRYVRLAYCVSYEKIVKALPEIAKLAKEYVQAL